MMGCLIILGLIGVAAVGGGAYVWYATTYTPPDRKPPAVPERAAGVHDGQRERTGLEHRGLFTNRLDEDRYR